MTSKTTQTNKKSKIAQTTEDQTSKGPASKRKLTNGHIAPVEHFHGEQTGKDVGDQGDLDEETLDRDAPFNRTYGLTDK